MQQEASEIDCGCNKGEMLQDVNNGNNFDCHRLGCRTHHGVMRGNICCCLLLLIFYRVYCILFYYMVMVE